MQNRQAPSPVSSRPTLPPGPPPRRAGPAAGSPGGGGPSGLGSAGASGTDGPRDGLRSVRQRVGPALKARRQRRRLSLHALAAQAGISPSHLSRIERGLSVPSYEVLDRVADALGSDLRALRTEEASARAVDGELDAVFDTLGLSVVARGELLTLSPQTRADLARALRHARRSA